MCRELYGCVLADIGLLSIGARGCMIFLSRWDTDRFVTLIMMNTPYVINCSYLCRDGAICLHLIAGICFGDSAFHHEDGLSFRITFPVSITIEFLALVGGSLFHALQSASTLQSKGFSLTMWIVSS